MWYSDPMTQRTLTEKVGDIRTTYAQFAEMLTAPAIRSILDKMTDEGARAAVAGDPGAYVASIQASLNLQRVISANDRAALIAAVMANGGSTRVVPMEGDEA